MNISQYSKTVQSVLFSTVAWGTATAGLLALVPDKRVAAVVSVLLLIVHVAQGVSVWLTKNEPVIDADAQAVGELAGLGDWHADLGRIETLLADMKGAFLPAKLVPTPGPVVTIDTPTGAP